MHGTLLNALLVFRTGVSFIAAIYFLETFFIITQDIHQPWAFLFLFLMAGIMSAHRIYLTCYPGLVDPLTSSLVICLATICMLIAAFKLNKIWKSF